MDLAAIQLRRAEEQIAPRGAAILKSAGWRPARKCECGHCQTCKKREWMRQERARDPKWTRLAAAALAYAEAETDEQEAKAALYLRRMACSYSRPRRQRTSKEIRRSVEFAVKRLAARGIRVEGP
jgi:hypothetical protein